MIKIEQTLKINRPLEEVYAYVTDNSKTAEWQSGLKESSVISDGPFGVGSQIKDVRTLAGRELESNVEVTAFEPNKKFGLKALSGPVQFEITQTFEAVDGGTKITFSTEGEPGGFFKLAGPMLAKQMEKEFAANSAKLKEILEA